MFATYKRTQYEGRRLWEDLIQAFRPHTLIAGSRPMATEWTDFLIHRGVHVQEGLNINKHDEIFAGLHRREHIPSNMYEYGIADRNATFRETWPRDPSSKRYGPSSQVSTKMDTQLTPEGTRRVTISTTADDVRTTPGRIVGKLPMRSRSAPDPENDPEDYYKSDDTDDSDGDYGRWTEKTTPLFKTMTAPLRGLLNIGNHPDHTNLRWQRHRPTCPI